MSNEDADAGVMKRMWREAMVNNPTKKGGD
jgi:hypothetical protein